MQYSLQNLLKFSTFIAQFRLIERMTYIRKFNRRENDAEHSCLLALTAWYIVSSEKLNLNMEKVMLYALAHDLVETYAGDTNIYSTDESVHISKEAREHEALLRIEKEFPEFPELITTIKEFEGRVNEEARFVYAVDKIQPTIFNYLDQGVSWKKQGVTLEQVISKKKDAIESTNSVVSDYFSQLIVLLKKEEVNLFNPEDSH